MSAAEPFQRPPPSPDRGAGQRGFTGVWRRLLGPLLLLGILVTTSLSVDTATMQEFVDTLRGGSWPLTAGVLLVVGALLTAVGLPGTLVSVSCGAIGGFAWGFPVAYAAALLAACLTALAGRRFGPGRPASGARTRNRLQKLIGAVGAADWRLVALLRLAPIFPYALINWFLGAWGVSWKAIILGTLIGLPLGTAVHVYLGSVGLDLLAGRALHPLEWILLGIGLASLPLTGWVLHRSIRRRSSPDPLRAPAPADA